MKERLRNINFKFYLNNKGIAPWLIPAAVSAGSALFGGLFGKKKPEYLPPQKPLMTPYPSYAQHPELINQLYSHMQERMKQPYGMPEDVSQAIWQRARQRAIPSIREVYATRGRGRGGQAIQAEAGAEREMAIDRAIKEAEWARESGTQRFGELMQMGTNVYPRTHVSGGQYQQPRQSQIPGFLQQIGSYLPWMGGNQGTSANVGRGIPWGANLMGGNRMPQVNPSSRYFQQDFNF